MSEERLPAASGRCPSLVSAPSQLKGIAEPLTVVLIAWSDESEVESSAPVARGVTLGKRAALPSARLWGS